MKFVTFFPEVLDVHLTKGVGMIPYYMHKRYGYHSELVGFRNDSSYARLRYVSGLDLVFLKSKAQLFGVHWALVGYLLKNAREIAVLNVYHLKMGSLIYGFLYKLLNKKGIAYLKMDMDLREELHEESWRRTLKTWLLRAFDVVSVETHKAFDFIRKTYPVNQSIIRFPTGFDHMGLEDELKEMRRYENKENSILTVGRIGMPQKNNEMLLDVLRTLDLKDWKVYFVGPVTGDFEVKVKEFYADHPEKRDQVILTGEIGNRVELFRHFIRSRIFVSTSNWEGFGSALIESLYFGNYVITTDMESADDITGFGKYGDIIPKNDRTALSGILQKLINDENIIKDRFQKAIGHIEGTFLWFDLVDILKQKIDEQEKIHTHQ